MRASTQPPDPLPLLTMAGPSSGDGTPDTAHSTVFQSNAIAPDSGPELVGEAPRLDPISISPLSAIEPIPMTLQNPSPSTPPRSNLISAIDTGQPAQPSPVATEPGLKTREAPKSRPISPDDKDFASRDEQRMHEEILVPLVPVRGTSLKRPLRRETTLRIVSKAQAAPPSPSHALTAPGIGIVDQFEWLDEEADDKEEVHWSTRETRLTRLMAKLRKQSPGKMAIISAIIGSIMLLIPGIVDLVLFVENPLAWWTNMRPVVDSNGNPLFVLGGYPVFYWTVWSIVTWNVFWLAWYFVPVLPYISLRIHFAITGYVSQSWQDRVVQLARVTKTWTTICITTLASYLTFRSAFVNTIAVCIYSSI